MIIRTPKKVRFTVIGNTLIDDQRLSWAALGMLVYLLSKPDNWRILPTHLIKERQLGRDGVYRLLKELERAGYVRKHQVKNAAGRMAGTDWCVFDAAQVPAPHPESPHPALPYPALPHPVDPTLTKTDISTKTDSNKHTYTRPARQRNHETAALVQPFVCVSPPAVEKDRGESPEPSVAVIPSASLSAVSADTPRRRPPGPQAGVEPVAAPAVTDPLPVVTPAPAIPPAPSRSASFPDGPALRVPLNAIEQDAFAWATRHPFWHSRITTPANLRRNFQEGKAFRLQFFDARNAKALASAGTTDQGPGDLVENHACYRGNYDAESDRYFQPSPAVGTLGPVPLGNGARLADPGRSRKLSAVERADRAEQRYYERLARERAAAARTIDGCRLDPPGHAAAVAAPDPDLRASLDIAIW